MGVTYDLRQNNKETKFQPFVAYPLLTYFAVSRAVMFAEGFLYSAGLRSPLAEKYRSMGQKTLPVAGQVRGFLPNRFSPGISIPEKNSVAGGHHGYIPHRTIRGSVA